MRVTMQADSSKKYFLATIIALVVVTIDYYTKRLIIQSLALHQSLDVIPHYLTIVHTRNRGIAFGFFAGQGSDIQTILLISTSCLAIIFMIYLITTLNIKQHYALFTLSLILGGAIGNLIDRIRWGEVVDFIDLHWYQYHWPAFNCADSAISIGLVLLIIGLIIKKFPS